MPYYHSEPLPFCYCFTCSRLRNQPEGKEYQFTNLDGNLLVVDGSNAAYIDYIRFHAGYSREIPLRGKIGHSELAMFTHNADREAFVAFVRPNNEGYAYVLMDDGKLLDGAFHRFEDGSCSVA